MRAARKASDSVNELMMRVGFPMGRFSATRYDYTRAQWQVLRFCRDCCREVHESGDATQNALRMVNQVYKLTYGSLASQVNDAVQPGMEVLNGSNLNELNPSCEVIDNRLITIDIPPLDRYVTFAAGADQPERDLSSNQLSDLGRRRFFCVRQMYLTLEFGAAYFEAKLFVNGVDIAVDGVIRDLITEIDERITDFDGSYIVCTWVQSPQTRVVQPQLSVRRSYVSDE